MPSTLAGPETIDRSLLKLVGVLLAGASVALLDTTIVVVAIDELTRAFDSTVHMAQWMMSAYLLAMAAAIPMLGWLIDRWGARRVWLVTLWLFLAGSVLCALAWSMASLIAFRVVQGLGGGLILPLVQAMLAAAAGPRRMGRAMALIGIPGQLAPVLGPVAGGIVLGALGWRWIFLANVPLCLLAILLSHRHLHPVIEPRPTRLDWMGALLMISATVSVLAGLSLVGQLSLAPLAPAVLLAVGTALLAAFLVHANRGGPRALLDLKLFRHRSFSVATAMMLFSGACVYGPMLLLPLFFQRARGVSVVDVGWLLAPQGLGLMAGLWLAGRYADRIGPRIVGLTSTVIASAGLAVFVVAAGASLVVLGAALVVLGVGLAGLGVAVSATSYRDVEPASISRATSLLNVVQRIGASLGTVVVALILHRQLAVRGTPTSTNDIQSAFAHSFAWMLGLLGVVLFVVLLLPSGPLPSPSPTETHVSESRTPE